MKWEKGNYSVEFNSGSTYTWTIIGGSQTGGGQTNFITVQWDSTGVGQITVVETDTTTWCEGNPVILIVNIGGTAINEFDDSGFRLEVYPNPSKGVFTVEIYDSRFTTYDLRVYDILGREIFNSYIVNRISYIDLSGHPAGIYHLQAITDMGIANINVIIE